MSGSEAFGPNLRRIRLQRGVSLKQLADSTKVAETLWAGLERNDFSRWPNGIFARAYVREYAKAIGVDPETTVDDFCRWFPNGDRRVGPTIRGQAEIVGHDDLAWQDEVPAAVADGNRRGSPGDAALASQKKAAGPLTALLRRVLSRA
jgi:transcriptional regulator with XRE-family HTH domain